MTVRHTLGGKCQFDLQRDAPSSEAAELETRPKAALALEKVTVTPRATPSPMVSTRTCTHFLLASTDTHSAAALRLRSDAVTALSGMPEPLDPDAEAHQCTGSA